MSHKENDRKNKKIEFTQNIINNWMLELIDEVSCGLCFEVHRSCKLGTFFLDELDTECQKRFQIVTEKGLDVFGQPPSKKQFECICPSCNRNLAASRFAPHLEKCMGMGRISSRIASRRIATNTNNNKKDSDHDSDEIEDEDLNYMPEKKAKKIKKEKHNNLPKKKKTKIKNVDSSGPATPSSSIAYSTSSINTYGFEDDSLLDI